MSRTAPELPGFVTVRGAGDRLRLAPRSVRDLIYTGRLPSTRLGRRHYLRASDVDLERRRRLGLPLAAPHRAPRPARPRRASAPTLHLLPDNAFSSEEPRAVTPSAARPRAGHRAPNPASAAARHARAEERGALFERWLHSGHRPDVPDLPYRVLSLAQAAACYACHRPIRTNGRMIQAEAVDGRADARLCLPCGRRTILAWSDARRREAIAARQMARDLSVAPVTTTAPAAA